MNRFDAMQIFVRVAEMASFTRAAESMGASKGNMSIAVQQLESLLGTRLFHRTTRRVELTQDGHDFYGRCRELLSDMDELQSMFRHEQQALRGRLRVDMPSRVARDLIVPKLPLWLDSHPHLELEISSTDRLVDLVREGFDCVLRAGELVDSSLIARVLGNLRMVNCASPAYLEAHGHPRRLEDLPKHRMIHYVNTLGTRPLGWEYFDGTVWRNMPMTGVVTVNNVDVYEASCLAGLGLIQTPARGIQRLIDAGKLVEVMPEYPAKPMRISLLYPNRRNLPRRVLAFMDWMEQLLALSAPAR